ncbi:MAG: Mut7-C RNAse domain-containing protein [Verrucomicrobiota bacterium]
MSRIRKAYEARLRQLLLQFGARRIDAGVRLLLSGGLSVRSCDRVSETRALDQIIGRLAARNEQFQLRRKTGATAVKDAPNFVCDVGLGGLARWLRAAGYEADWIPGIDDEDLVLLAQRTGRTILTTDSLMMERRVLRDGVVPALWVPPTLKVREQLAIVLRDLRLPMRAPLCMRCGGKLRTVTKEEVRDRIPPKTRLWLDEYFVCTRCHQLFWEGTHWQRIKRRLATGGSA